MSFAWMHLQKALVAAVCASLVEEEEFAWALVPASNVLLPWTGDQLELRAPSDRSQRHN